MMFKKEDLEMIEVLLVKYRKTRFKRHGEKAINHAIKEIQKLQRLKLYSE